MKLSYKFSNLLGCVYRKGNLIFSPDGNRLISPVGNRVSVFDLKNNKSETLPVQSQLNITTLALSPTGHLLIAVNEDGEAMLINMSSRAVLHTYHFHRPVHAISFSPDGKKFAATKEKDVLVFRTPGQTVDFNPFVIDRVFYGAHDDTTCIDWTTDSRAFCVGGLDMNTRVYGAERFENLIVYSMGGHRDAIIGSFFEDNSLDLYTVSKDAQLCVYECDSELSDLKPLTTHPLQNEEEEEDKEDEDVEGDDDNDDELVVAAKRRKVIAKQMREADQKQTTTKILYRRTQRHSLKDNRPYVTVTSATYHKKSHILVTGFSDGVFYLHEMPQFNLMHSLSISDQSITSVTMNSSGDWVAFGSAQLGQLVVWEWQSETYQLKQQGHFATMTCLDYSPDGQYIVTGGDDAKVKLWDTLSGFCTVTFGGESATGQPIGHTAGVTAVTFARNGQIIVSASLDGTVRAFDMKRYKNFKTMTAPESRSTQFASLAVNHSGDIVAAGAQDTFEIFIWLMKDGHLLNILSGHEGPVSCLSFSATHGTLASGSWDHTLRLWDVYTGKGSREIIQLSSDALAVAYRPDGAQVSVCTLDGHITCWDVTSGLQTATIESRCDLGYSRRDQDKISAKTSSLNKAFNTLSYTADGSCLVAGGKSKYICIYSIEDQLLVKKFEITQNLSLDGTQEFLDRRKMTEFGSLALIERGGEGEEREEMALPGVRKGDMSSRSYKPQVRVTCVRFSPTGESFAATTTEGLLVYSLDSGVVFDPYELDLDITPASIRATLAQREYSNALMMSLRLNELNLVQEVIEAVPLDYVDYLSRTLPSVYIDKLLSFIAARLETSAHLEFYLDWTQRLLVSQGPRLKQRQQRILPVVRALQKSLSRLTDQLAKLCDHNKYTLDYIITLGEIKKIEALRKEALEEAKASSDAEEDDNNVTLESEQWSDDDNDENISMET